VLDEGVVVGDTTIVHFLEADTITVLLPYDEQFSINRHHRFYARLNIPEESRDLNYVMRGWIDGDEKFNAASELHEDGELLFLYYFRRGRDNVIHPQP
jgi:hypothetical protein